MHGPTLSAFLLIVVAMAATDRMANASAPDVVAEARLRLAQDDGKGAATLLEGALLDATGTVKGEVLGLLRQAYESAARRAEADGRAADAETYRENLRILTRKPGGTPPAPEPATAGPRPLAAPGPEAEGPPAEPMKLAPVLASEPPSPRNLGTEMPTAGDPAAPPPAQAEPSRSDLNRADAAFEARRYDEAGRLYAALAAAKLLPANRGEHWAYCRSLDVARRINAQPRTEAEWAVIDAEIDQICVLSPKNWLGVYLKDRAAARVTSAKKARPSKTVVRGSSPEEPAVRVASNLKAPSPSRAAAAAAPVPAQPAAIGAGRWAVRDTANFRIYHADPTLAEQVAEIAEATRRDQSLRWSGKPTLPAWQPRCEIYLYPTARRYAAETGQPEDSPGFSTMGMNEGRIISRRVNLRADHPGLVPAVLPHEVTHVILADHFTMQQIPRWADEGMAVLSEPTDEQDRRASDLVEPLGKNVLFPVETLMGMDYPDNRYWTLYYAQSVSLTRFLVEQGSPAQLVQFLQGAQKNGFESELRRTYRIDGFPDLQARWVAYARNSATPRLATGTSPGPGTRAR